MRKEPSNDASDLLELLEVAQADEMLDPATSLDIVQQTLRAYGIHPSLVELDAAELTNELCLRGAGSRNAPTYSIAQAAGSKHPLPALRLSWMSREQMVARVAALRSSPRTPARISRQLQREALENKTEEEMRKLLEDIETVFSSDSDESDE